MTFAITPQGLLAPAALYAPYSDRPTLPAPPDPVSPDPLSPTTTTASQTSTDATQSSDPLDTSSIMAMSKASQRLLNDVQKAAKELGIPLSKAQQRKLAKELGRRQRGEESDSEDAPDSTEAEFSSLAHSALGAANTAVHAVEGAASSTGHFISGHAEQIGVPAGVAVVLGGTAAVAVDVVGGLGAVAALF